MVLVEVRQGTLHGRGWSWLRSGTEQCGSQIAVGRGGQGGGRRSGRQEEEEEDEEDEDEDERKRKRKRKRERKRKAADIKSNNPHLAGGEKSKIERR